MALVSSHLHCIAVQSIVCASAKRKFEPEFANRCVDVKQEQQPTQQHDGKVEAVRHSVNSLMIRLEAGAWNTSFVLAFACHFTMFCMLNVSIHFQHLHDKHPLLFGR